MVLANCIENNLYMKTNKYKVLILTSIIAASLLLSFEGFSQNTKLPDGTIVYPDGTRKLPDGTIIYKDGTGRKNGSTLPDGRVVLPDGRVVFPDGSRRYPKDRRHDRHDDDKVYFPDGSRRYPNNKRDDRRYAARRLPPGLANKIYGGEARDYAPGQQKKRNGYYEWREDDKNHRDNGKRENWKGKKD